MIGRKNTRHLSRAVSRAEIRNNVVISFRDSSTRTTFYKTMMLGTRPQGDLIEKFLQ
jgi:hypothetical protein